MKNNFCDNAHLLGIIFCDIMKGMEYRDEKH